MPGESVPGSTPEDGQQAQDQEEADRGDLQGGEPELELAEVLHGGQVRAAEDHHEQRDPHPLGVPGQPAVTIVRGADRLRPTATHSSAQNIQPAVKPAQEPMARSACTEKEPEAGFAADISPSIRMTSMTSAPETA